MDLFLEELFILLRPSFTLVDASLHLLRHCDKFVALPPRPKTCPESKEGNLVLYFSHLICAGPHLEGAHHTPHSPVGKSLSRHHISEDLPLIRRGQIGWVDLPEQNMALSAVTLNQQTCLQGRAKIFLLGSKSVWLKYCGIVCVLGRRRNILRAILGA